MTDYTERNRQIVARHLNGDLHPDIAWQWGISRERVRQIVRNAGEPPRRESQKLWWEHVADTVDRERLTTEEAAIRFGENQRTIRALLRKLGVRTRPAPTRMDSPEIARLAELVRAGASIRSVTRDRPEEAALGRYCARNGIAALHGKWRDRSARLAIIAETVATRGSWDDAAAKVSAVEGVPVAGLTLYRFASRRHLLRPDRSTT